MDFEEKSDESWRVIHEDEILNGTTKSPKIVLEEESREKLVYNVSDRPPIHLTVFFAFQVNSLFLTLLIL